MNVDISPAFPAVQMRLICAWCLVELRDGPEDLVSHGICADCREQVERACSRLLGDMGG